MQNDAPVLLEEMRQQNLLNTLQLLELEADGSSSAPDAASPDTPTKLYQQMHAILDKVGICFITAGEDELRNSSQNLQE